MGSECSWEPERFWTSPDGKCRTLGVGKRKSVSREVVDCLMKWKGKSSMSGGQIQLYKILKCMHRKEERRLKENQWDEEMTEHWSKESPVYGATKQIYWVKWPNKPYTQGERTQARTHKMKHKIKSTTCIRQKYILKNMSWGNRPLAL